MAQWPIEGGVGGGAAASPLTGARAHREVDAPSSSGLVVVPFTAEPEAWPRGGVTTTVGGVPLPHRLGLGFEYFSKSRPLLSPFLHPIRV